MRACHRPCSYFVHLFAALLIAADEIYAAFADPTRLATWWGPKGFTNTFEVFDFQPGGAWKFVMHGPDGQDYPNESVSKELAAGEKVAIQHVVPPLFTLTVSLLPTGEGTLLQWVQEFEDPKVAAAVRHICEPSNEENLDRLHRHLEA